MAHVAASFGPFVVLLGARTAPTKQMMASREKNSTHHIGPPAYLPAASPSRDSSAPSRPRPAACSSRRRAGPLTDDAGTRIGPAAADQPAGDTQIKAAVTRNLGTLKELLESAGPAAEDSS